MQLPHDIIRNSLHCLLLQETQLLCFHDLTLDDLKIVPMTLFEIVEIDLGWVVLETG